MSAARFDERLGTRGYDEVPWNAPLSAETLLAAFQRLHHSLSGGPTAAICISSFMHSFLVVRSDGSAATPVHTWMDAASAASVDFIRDAIRSSGGPGFHERTGCHYHPMFPAFKLADPALAGRGTEDRIVSPKTFLVEALTGECVEDYGMASASGLLNIHSAAWDDDLLQATSLTARNLPRLSNHDAIAGKTASGTVVVNGSGDGFMASLGSGCSSPNRIAITLGTSAAARQMVRSPFLDPTAGTFCYRADSKDDFLLGCASSNGGNVLDWARREFGTIHPGFVPTRDIPVFLPWLHGERSLEWNANLRPVWHGRRPDHTPEELQRSALEGVLFNLAQYVEVIERGSGIPSQQIVLSGNGFLDVFAAPVLSALLSAEILLPAASGLGTLRGTAVCAWRALGYDATPAIERLLNEAPRSVALRYPGLEDRFARFKQLRQTGN